MAFKRSAVRFRLAPPRGTDRQEREQHDRRSLITGGAQHHPGDDGEHAAEHQGSPCEGPTAQYQGYDRGDRHQQRNRAEAEMADAGGEVGGLPKGAESGVGADKNGERHQPEHEKLSECCADGVQHTRKMVRPRYRLYWPQRLALRPDPPDGGRQASDEHHERQENGQPKIIHSFFVFSASYAPSYIQLMAKSRARLSSGSEMSWRVIF